jgi:hypothetical protein
MSKYSAYRDVLFIKFALYFSSPLYTYVSSVISLNLFVNFFHLYCISHLYSILMFIYFNFLRLFLFELPKFTLYFYRYKNTFLLNFLSKLLKCKNKSDSSFNNVIGYEMDDRGLIPG